MFIYNVWALFLVVSLSAASTSSKISKSKSKKDQPLQHVASQPITTNSPGSPIALYASTSQEQIKKTGILSTSAPAKPLAFLAGFGRTANSPSKQESLQDDRLSPHVMALYQSRVGELLKPAPNQESAPKPQEPEVDPTMQELFEELEKIEGTSDNDYFEDPILDFE
jgi:hypothetical protein